VAISTHFPPPVITDITAAREATTHMLCCSWAMYFSAAVSSENEPGQHEFGLENRPSRLDPAVEGGAHPSDRRMPDLPLRYMGKPLYSWMDN
jgi:hypothetical protein